MIGSIQLIAAASILAIGIAAGAGVQELRLDAAKAELSSVRSDLDAARQEAARISRDRTSAIAALSGERDRALAAEVEASRLRKQIAKDAGTDRDAETAPVLRDTVRRLGGRA